MASIGTVIYANPPTFMEMLLEFTNYIEHARQEPTTTKTDVLDSMENRMSLLVGKLASHPTCTAFVLSMGGDTAAEKAPAQGYRKTTINV